MLEVVDVLPRVLVPFLVAGGTFVGALLLYLLAQRLVGELVARRRQTVEARYRPLLDAIVQLGPEPDLLAKLRRTSRVHRRLVARLLLVPLRAARGELVISLRAAAHALGMVELWIADVNDRRWWVRADALRALGLVDEPAAPPLVIAAFGNRHEEVRAAAVEAAGHLGDVSAIPALLGHLRDGSRFQRARVIEALRGLGADVTPALCDFAHLYPDVARVAADVLGMIGTTAAVDPLLEWCEDPRGDVRAAALGALGSIGLDDSSYYIVLRGLGDPDPHVRAMAARALGRGGREAAATSLAARLDDEWLPAAEAAAALMRLGTAGRAALVARAAETSLAGDLAREMLWVHHVPARPRPAAV